MTIDCKSLLRDAPHTTHPALGTTLSTRAASAAPRPSLRRLRRSHAPPQGTAQHSTPWRFVYDPRPPLIAPCRSRADLNPAPTASLPMRSPMAHVCLANGRGSVDVLCLSAHPTAPPTAISLHTSRLVMTSTTTSRTPPAAHPLPLPRRWTEAPSRRSPSRSAPRSLS